MKIDPSRSIEYKWSILKILLCLSAFALFVIAGLYIASEAMSASEPNESDIFMGYAGAAFFGLGGVAFLAYVLINRDHSIEIGPQGIIDRRLTSDVVPWSGITNISKHVRRHYSYVVLEVTEDVHAKLKSSMGFWKKTKGLVGERGVYLNPTALNVGTDELFETLKSYAKAHNSPAVEHLD